MGLRLVTRLRDLVELVRAPAALTVPGDSLAGAASAGWPGSARGVALLPVASTCLYWAGMALNDYADREQDAVERPERPIPSGRITARTALGVAAGLTAAGVGLAAAAGGRTAAVTAGALAAAVWAYDLGPKTGALGAATMASTRALDVVLGATAGGGAGVRRSLVPAALVAGHTASITSLSRGEVHGTSTASARGSAVATAAVAAAVGLHSLRTSPNRASGVVTAALSGLYATTVLAAQLKAVRSPDGPTVRRATGAGIRGLVPLQGALAAAAGSPAVGLGVAASAPVGRWAMKMVSPT
ncbi:4-hydroxybenzoate polyprenyltransferase [Terracoccus luteus]|uniref:4-hydroxybenzoate polyprenyltransferase n=1 Tax=Terracoccus luteus TaxID=53356 RepID=A0A495Y275_9MICO|nr:UbiA family prenyltransferase [Terracoccus luteus]RKT79344.1 4-hydroxybenzoate polyprenyltransferase [Terracoccus luteus]